MTPNHRYASAINRQIFSLDDIAKLLIKTVLCITMIFGYTIANAKPITLKLDNNLISGSMSSPLLFIDWINQVGAAGGYTLGLGISADNLGNVYVTGYTTVGISGETQNGFYDYFIAKYGPDYNLLWTRQVGAPGGYTQGYGISADESGNVYVTGFTRNGISGQKQNGYDDYFIAKYESNGNLEWTRQVGAYHYGGGLTLGNGISIGESGNIYVTGYTTVGISGQSQFGGADYFIAKYNTNGNLLWTRQVGGIEPNGSLGYTYGNGISADESGNIYVTGYTTVGLYSNKQNGYNDYFIAKYNPSGTILWIKQVGGGGITRGHGVSTESGNAYITGDTTTGLYGNKQNGYEDYFIAKYTSEGSLLWTKQVGSSGGETEGWGISADSYGDIYVTGRTTVGLSGQSKNEINNYFVARYDVNGNLLVTTQNGGGGYTQGYGISADELGAVYITGGTNVALPGLTQNGLSDYFAVKYLSVN